MHLEIVFKMTGERKQCLESRSKLWHFRSCLFIIRAPAFKINIRLLEVYPGNCVQTGGLRIVTPGFSVAASVHVWPQTKEGSVAG